jgi:transcriptional activator of cad operon
MSMLLSGTRFKIGACTVNFSSGELQRTDDTIVLDARLARLLMHLAHRPDEVVSIDELLDQVWEGVVVSSDSVYQAITALRKILDDDPKNPAYIVTVPRRGYRLIAPVINLDAQAAGVPEIHAAVVAEPVPALNLNTGRLRKRLIIFGVVGVISIASAGLMIFEGVMSLGATQKSAATAHSIVVLPFLDLTDSMTEEPFADGMVEELINKLAKVPGLAVAPAADSFFYKDKDVTTGAVAQALHVNYVLEGSVRKSGNTLRVTVRLTRAPDHFVVWSETYDRPWQDKLIIQDDIASAVSRSLAKSL